jgi:dynein heavy chain
MEWWQPVPQSSACVSGNHLPSSWPGCPCPRGSHSATLVSAPGVGGGGSSSTGGAPRKQLYVFGGYGGAGYGRRDLDDLHVLDCDTWKWSRPAAKGRAPEKRSGHSACACDASLYVFGGWSAAKQFGDMHVLDCAQEPPVWAEVEAGMPDARWNHAACGVMAIPSWKIFVFGGTGAGAKGLTAGDALGTTHNDIAMLDTGAQKWTLPAVSGVLPPPRSDSVLSYDVKGSKLMIFGGWSNEWFNDV